MGTPTARSVKPKKERLFIGGILRPPRFLTVGRRRADRWLVRGLAVLMVLMALFIVYTSVQQGVAEEDRRRTNQKTEQITQQLEQQNRDVLCLAYNTQQFEIAVSEFLLSADIGPVARPSDEAYAQLRAAQESLKKAQVSQAAQAQATPECFGPPTTTR